MSDQPIRLDLEDPSNALSGKVSGCQRDGAFLFYYYAYPIQRGRAPRGNQ